MTDLSESIKKYYGMIDEGMIDDDKDIIIDAISLIVSDWLKTKLEREAKLPITPISIVVKGEFTALYEEACIT